MPLQITCETSQRTIDHCQIEIWIIAKNSFVQYVLIVSLHWSLHYHPIKLNVDYFSRNIHHDLCAVVKHVFFTLHGNHKCKKIVYLFVWPLFCNQFDVEGIFGEMSKKWIKIRSTQSKETKKCVFLYISHSRRRTEKWTCTVTHYEIITAFSSALLYQSVFGRTTTGTRFMYIFYTKIMW